jgi:hypothetical protein
MAREPFDVGAIRRGQQSHFPAGRSFSFELIQMGIQMG